ncbi:MAG: porin, partial [Planctomycetia bacterium]|nr:porin [Planctomycetia bacterium]
YSIGNWFLWQFWKKDDRDIMTGVWRSEAFRDNNGVRTGFASDFFEFTLGLIIKPKPYLWIRPEARYDFTNGAKAYTDGTRSSQFTLGVDAILLY